MRHLWIGLAILLSPVALALTFFWIVFHQPSWLEPVLGIERTDLFLRRCVDVRLTWPARDSDGDCVPDWFEEIYRTDSHDPRSHPSLGLDALSPTDLGYANERMHLRYGGSLETFVMHWPHGYRVNVQADAPVLLLPGGKGAPVTGPLELAAQADGTFEFDVLAAQPGDIVLQFSRASTGEVLNAPGFRPKMVGYRLPPLPTAMHWRGTDEHYDVPNSRSPEPVGEVAWPLLPEEHLVPLFLSPLPLVWQSLGATGYRYLLEIARGDDPDDWQICEVVPALGDGDGRGRVLLYEGVFDQAADHFPGYYGPLIFRVVPAAQRE